MTAEKVLRQLDRSGVAVTTMKETTVTTGEVWAVVRGRYDD